MFNYEQFRQKIVLHVLHGLGMWNEYAESLMMGTCAVESQGGTYLVQLNHGPAVGIYQMEPATHDDIWAQWLPNKAAIASNLLRTCNMATKPTASDMVNNLFYATAMARIQYFRNTPAPVPDSEEGRAEFWLRYYNRGSEQTADKYLKAHAAWIAGGQNVAIARRDEKGRAKSKG